jgi:hypothetical protein
MNLCLRLGRTLKRSIQTLPSSIRMQIFFGLPTKGLVVTEETFVTSVTQMRLYASYM